jgi:hypothetical protein
MIFSHLLIDDRSNFSLASTLNIINEGAPMKYMSKAVRRGIRHA